MCSYDGTLYWELEKMDEPETAPIFIYGELQVLLSRPAIYYCGLGWMCSKHEAGGYCGIQDQKSAPRNVRFSVWDTSKTLHASLAYADGHTLATHFDDEGSGESTKMFYSWKEGDVFRFAIVKESDKSGKSTLTTFYFYDRGAGKWTAEATISSPADDKGAGLRFDGSIYSFLEDFSSDKLGVSRACIYRIWAGHEPTKLTFAQRARASGRWGIVNGGFCMAGGEPSAVNAVIAKQPSVPGDIPINWSVPVEESARHVSIKADHPLPPEIVRELECSRSHLSLRARNREVWGLVHKVLYRVIPLGATSAWTFYGKAPFSD